MLKMFLMNNLPSFLCTQNTIFVLLEMKKNIDTLLHTRLNRFQRKKNPVNEQYATLLLIANLFLHILLYCIYTFNDATCDSRYVQVLIRRT